MCNATRRLANLAFDVITSSLSRDIGNDTYTQKSKPNFGTDYDDCLLLLSEARHPIHIIYEDLITTLDPSDAKSNAMVMHFTSVVLLYT
jgi:hypothetical protein